MVSVPTHCMVTSAGVLAGTNGFFPKRPINVLPVLIAAMKGTGLQTAEDAGREGPQTLLKVKMRV